MTDTPWHCEGCPFRGCPECPAKGGVVMSNRVAPERVSAHEPEQETAGNDRVGGSDTAPAGASTPVLRGLTTTSLPLSTGGIVAAHETTPSALESRENGPVQ